MPGSGLAEVPSLRPYQRKAVARVIAHFKVDAAPAVVVLPTGSGKSLVIAELARLARGRVLVLAHVRELVEQNHAKYLAYGLDADIYSAGLGRKQSSRQVVFGSVQSVVRHLEAFAGGGFTLLIIDECHRVTLEADSSYRQVIDALQADNPALRILGLTATPYRLGQGFIYRHHVHGMVRGEEDCFFRECVFELPLRQMVREGYLSPPVRLDMAVEHYDFERLAPTAEGRFSEAALNQVVAGNRATPSIVSDIVERSRDRHGVMIFAATIAHAQEVLGHLPGDQAALITGTTPPEQRLAWIEAFKASRLKYLVNVAVLTTGFDAPYVDVIAILRPTESVSLYQQIIGRGLRLAPGKKDCLILDYAGNPWDIYAPEVGSPRPDSDSEPVQVACPECGHANLFWGKREGDLVIEHYGRRCQGLSEAPGGRRVQCEFRFRFKVCQACGAQNDIAARRCHGCQAALIDADDKLRDALGLKGNQVLRVSGMTLQATFNGRGLPRLKVTYHDEDGATVSDWFALETPAQRHAFEHAFLRDHLRAPGMGWQPASPDAVVEEQWRLRHPDFVIAHKVGRHLRIRARLFDYQGRFRTASSAG